LQKSKAAMPLGFCAIVWSQLCVPLHSPKLADMKSMKQHQCQHQQQRTSRADCQCRLLMDLFNAKHVSQLVTNPLHAQQFIVTADVAAAIDYAAAVAQPSTPQVISCSCDELRNIFAPIS
jgi:hypothetical protein